MNGKQKSIFHTYVVTYVVNKLAAFERLIF